MAEPGAATAERTRTRDRWADLATYGVVAVAFLLPIPGLWTYQGPPMEEGFMLAFPQRLLAGDVPHVDFLHLYGPGSLFVLAGIYELFGDVLEVERTVGMLQHLLLVVAMLVVARPWNRMIALAATLTTLLITITPVGLTALAWNGALGTAVAGIACCAVVARGGGGERQRWFAVAAGALGAVTLLYRPDMVVGVGLVSLLAWRWLGEHRRAALTTMVAGAALYLPFVWWVGPRAAFEGMFLEPVFELRDGRALPVPPSWGELDGAFQRAGALRTNGWPFPMPEFSAQVAMWFWLVVISEILVVGVAIWNLRRRPNDGRARTLALLAAFGLGIVTQAFQRPDTSHLSWVSCVTFAAAVLAVAEIARDRGIVDWRQSALAIAPMAVVFVVVIPFYPVRNYVDLVGQSFGRNEFGVEIVRGDRRFYYGDAAPARDAQVVVDTLDELGRPGDRLLVGPQDLRFTPYNDSFVYYLFPEMEPATRYIEMDPGIANAEDSGLADEVADADWVVLSTVWSTWVEDNASVEPGPNTPNEVLAEEFCLVVDLPRFQLHGRCDR